jgi:hypothetical protein
MPGAGFIGRGFQRAEQEVEVAATLGLRQLARRFRQFLLLPGRCGRIILRGCGERHGGQQRSQQGRPGVA